MLVHLSAHSCRRAGEQFAGGQVGMRVGVLQALRTYPRFGWPPQSSPQHGGRRFGGRTGCSQPMWPQTAPLGTPTSWNAAMRLPLWADDSRVHVHGRIDEGLRRCRRTRHKSCAPLQGPGRGMPGGRAAGWSLLLRKRRGIVVPGEQQPAPHPHLVRRVVRECPSARRPSK